MESAVPKRPRGFYWCGICALVGYRQERVLLEEEGVRFQRDNLSYTLQVFLNHPLNSTLL